MSRQGQDRGQATLEVALILPLLALLTLAVVQVGVIAASQVRVTHAAREGARAAAVGEPVSAAVANALGGLTGSASTSGGGEAVEVTVTAVQPTTVPIVGRFFDEITLTASATMRVEDG